MNPVDEAAMRLTLAARTPTTPTGQRHFTTAWRLLEPVIRQRARRITRTDQLADDATGLAAIAIWRTVLRHHRNDAPISAALTNTVIRGAIADTLTMTTRRDPERYATLDDHIPATTDSVETNDRIELAARTLENNGNPAQARLLRAIAYDSEDTDQLAKNLGVTKVAIRVAKHRIRDHADLRTLFGIGTPEGEIVEQLGLFAVTTGSADRDAVREAVAS